MVKIVDKKLKIQDDSKLYSFSFKKICKLVLCNFHQSNGDIKSLDDKISDYVPEC